MRSHRAPILASLILCVGAGGAAGYAVAANRSPVSMLTGTFYVGDHQASGFVDGWIYGMIDSVPWLDSSDTWHDSGWPACRGPLGTTHSLRFGYTGVDRTDAHIVAAGWCGSPA